MHLALQDRKSMFEAINVYQGAMPQVLNPLVLNVGIVVPGKVGKRDKSNILKGAFLQL